MKDTAFHPIGFRNEPKFPPCGGDEKTQIPDKRFGVHGAIAACITVGIILMFCGLWKINAYEEMRMRAYEILNENEKEIGEAAERHAETPISGSELYSLVERARTQRKLVEALELDTHPPGEKPALISVRTANVSP